MMWSCKRSDYNNPTVFTDPYVNRLRELRPGVLRNWGDQLGSTLDNQLATPFARQGNAYSPRHRIARNYHYSLHEFLQLSQVVGAEPWYVIPPTFTGSELQNLVALFSCASRQPSLREYPRPTGSTRPLDLCIWSNPFGIWQ